MAYKTTIAALEEARREAKVMEDIHRSTPPEHLRQRAKLESRAHKLVWARLGKEIQNATTEIAVNNIVNSHRSDSVRKSVREAVASMRHTEEEAEAFEHFVTADLYLCRYEAYGRLIHVIESDQVEGIHRSGHSRPHPLPAVMNSGTPEFWRGLRLNFQALITEQRDLGINEQHELWLKGSCFYPPGYENLSRCLVRTAVSGKIVSDFEDIATRGAFELGCPVGIEPVAFWLYCLARNLQESTRGELQNEIIGEPGCGGIIQDLGGSCVGFCSRLAADAERRLKKSGTPPGEQKPDEHPEKDALSGEFFAAPNPKTLDTDAPRSPSDGDRKEAIGFWDGLADQFCTLKASTDSFNLVATFVKLTNPTGEAPPSEWRVQGGSRQRWEGLAYTAGEFLDENSNDPKVRWLEELLKDADWPERQVSGPTGLIEWHRTIPSLADVSERRCRTLSMDAKIAATARRRAAGPATKILTLQPADAIPTTERLDSNETPVSPKRAQVRNEPLEESTDSAAVAKTARAMTVAKLIGELDVLHPQMFGDESEYARLDAGYAEFLTFRIVESRPDLKVKVLAIQGSTRHFRLAQELAAAYHGRKLSTIQDDWKRYKPSAFRRSATA